MQSKIAIGSGGFGVKVGWHINRNLNSYRKPHTDFIFAVLSEEYGMTGFTILMLIYLFIVARGLIIGVNAQNSFWTNFKWCIDINFLLFMHLSILVRKCILPVVGVLFTFNELWRNSFGYLNGWIWFNHVHLHTHKNNPFKGTK